MISSAGHLSIPSKALLGLLAAICALAVFVAPGAAAGSGAPELSLTFPSREAHLSGSQASVWVTCQGPEERDCNGTLTLTRSGKKHQVPFSVIAGTNQSLSVPLAINSSAKRIVAVARTVQADGSYLRYRVPLHVAR